MQGLVSGVVLITVFAVVAGAAVFAAVRMQRAARGGGGQAGAA